MNEQITFNYTIKCETETQFQGQCYSSTFKCVRFGSAKNEKELKDRGVKHISLPRKGKINTERKQMQSQPWFRRLQRWRAGGEAIISLLKRKFGLDRCRFRKNNGTETWVATEF